MLASPPLPRYTLSRDTSKDQKHCLPGPWPAFQMANRPLACEAKYPEHRQRDTRGEGGDADRESHIFSQAEHLIYKHTGVLLS